MDIAVGIDRSYCCDQSLGQNLSAEHTLPRLLLCRSQEDVLIRARTFKLAQV
jgi:hypothetical protein